MKYLFPLLICLGLLFAACNPEKQNPSDNKIIIGSIDSIHSKILNEKQKIWVYTPDNSIYASQKYPVVYFFDGDAHFSSLMGMIQQLSVINGNSVLPQMILVGITNTDRTRDLTPTRVLTDPEIPADFLKTSGGGENFTSFIEKELIPYIDSLYPAAPYRTLVGHSFGGLMVINTLINHTKLFNAYVAIDPSMWWDDLKLLNQAKSVLAEKDFEGTSLFLAIANTLEPGLDINTVYSDTSISTRHVRSILELNRYLNENPKNNLRYNWRFYKDDDHASVPLIAGYDAFRFIFGFYKPNYTYYQLKNPAFNLDSMVSNYSRQLSENLGYKCLPPESYLNSLGYACMGFMQYENADKLFRMNVEYYPSSSNVYDSMGELLMKTGDTINAIRNYEKSSELNPQNENAKNMIRRMKEKVAEK